MKNLRIALLIFLALGLTAVQGCSDSPEAVAEEAVGVFKELNEILESVKDTDSAKAAAARIEKLAPRMQDLKARMDALEADVTPEQKEAIKEKFEESMNDEMSKLMANSMKIMFNEEYAKILGPAMEKLEVRD